MINSLAYNTHDNKGDNSGEMLLVGSFNISIKVYDGLEKIKWVYG